MPRAGGRRKKTRTHLKGEDETKVEDESEDIPKCKLKTPDFF